MKETSMKPADLQLTTQVTGHGRFLFISLPSSCVDADLVAAMDDLWLGMENMHQAEGHPSEEAFRQGRFQLLRAEPASRRERDIPHPAVSGASALIRVAAA